VPLYQLIITSSIMNVDKELFASYAFYAGICAVKTLGMAFLTVRQRVSNKNCISPEDSALNPGSRVGVGLAEDVERVRRAHLNDLENILPFLTLGFLYLFTGPSLSTATMLFRLFTGARIAHSVVYLWSVPQPARALAFFAAMGVNLYLGYKVITHFM
jgi:glutathione S-transferase